MEKGRGAGANVLLSRRLLIRDWTGRQFRFDQISDGWLSHHVAQAPHRARERPQILRL
jgi:hypothetical protein